MASLVGKVASVLTPTEKITIWKAFDIQIRDFPDHATFRENRLQEIKYNGLEKM